MPPRFFNERGTPFAQELIDGLVTKFQPKNGGWGLEDFSCYPDLPKTREDGNCHIIYTLGRPDVIWWAGAEHGYLGYGVGIYCPDLEEVCQKAYIGFDSGWALFYNSRGEVTIGPEKLALLGIMGFQLKANKNGIELTELKIGVEKTSNLARLSSAKHRVLTADEIKALQALAHLV